MTKVGPPAAAVVAVAALLAGCGSAKTVTVTSSTPSISPSSSSPAGATKPVATGAVAACFKSGGAVVTVNPAGNGEIIRALTRDSGTIAVLKGRNAQVAARIAQVYSTGWKVTAIKSDPTSYALSKGTLTHADGVLLSKCAK